MDDRSILASKAGAIERHVRMIADEFRMGFETVAAIDRPAVTIFGSARLPAGDSDYDAAVLTGWTSPSRSTTSTRERRCS